MITGFKNETSIPQYFVKIDGDLEVVDNFVSSGTTTINDLRTKKITSDAPDISPLVEVDGYFEIESTSGGLYPNPVGAVILYADSDNVLKTKNPAGESVAISELPIIAQMYIVGSNPRSFANPNVDTLISGPWEIQSFTPYLSLNSTNYTRYTGAKEKNFKLNLNIAFTGAATTTYNFCVYKNPILNGSQEVIGGSQIFITPFTIPAAGSYTVSYSQFTPSIFTNDTFGVAVRSSNAANTLTTTRVLLALEAYSDGVD